MVFGRVLGAREKAEIQHPINKVFLSGAGDPIVMVIGWMVIQQPY